MTTQETGEIRGAWDSIATGYDEHVTPSHMGLANEGLNLAGLKSGQKFLDVACGTGAMSIPAARMGAKVTSVDISPAMIERLKARAKKEGLTIDARAMDGHNLDLENNSFDIVGSQFGVMLFPDLPKGVREMARVCKPGGKVLLHAYGSPMKIEFFGFMMQAMATAVPGFQGPPMDPLPLPFQMADPEKFRSELSKAGLKDVNIKSISETLKLQSGKQLYDWVVNSNPIGAHLVAEFNNDQKAVVVKSLEAQIRERAGGSGPASLTSPIHIGIGTK